MTFEGLEGRRGFETTHPRAAFLLPPVKTNQKVFHKSLSVSALNGDTLKTPKAVVEPGVLQSAVITPV